MEKRTLRLFPVYLLTMAGYVALHFFIRRGDFTGHAAPADFTHPLLIFTGLFLLYGWILNQSRSREQVQMGMVVAIGIRIVLIFALPNFSDDFWRFLWDGKLWDAGINPFSGTPSEIVAQSGGPISPEIFAAMNSREYPTVYPPLLQFLFTTSWKLSGGNVQEAVYGLKFFIFLAEAGSIYFLYNLCKKFSLNPRNVLLYALNPVVIFELTGNLHFEAIMIFCLLAAIWHFSELRFLPTGIFLGLGVSAKLLPLMVFPFFLRRIGILKTLVLGMIALSVFGLLFIPFLFPGLWQNFFNGLHLYFNHFEFNASFYYLGKWWWGWEAKLWLPKLLTGAVAGIILLSTLLEKKPGIRNLPSMFLLAFTAYYLAATTVHPWYLTTLVALGALTTFRFPVVWTLFLPLTYLTYYSGYQENYTLITLEYLILGILILLEWQFTSRNRSLEEFLLRNRLMKNLYRKSIPARVKIKQGRISKHLNKNDTVLDIGSGNGGVCQALQTEGFRITPCDVKDNSFFEQVKPVIYDGKKLPFADGEFDTVTLITVLHHCPKPEEVLAEAVRVARKKIIVMEDIYKNALQKHLTYFTDKLVNLEFAGHPHTNKNDEGWKKAFSRQGLKLVYEEQFQTLLFYTQVIYVLEKKDASSKTE